MRARPCGWGTQHAGRGAGSEVALERGETDGPGRAVHARGPCQSVLGVATLHRAGMKGTRRVWREWSTQQRQTASRRPRQTEVATRQD